MAEASINQLEGDFNQVNYHEVKIRFFYPVKHF